MPPSFLLAFIFSFCSFFLLSFFFSGSSSALAKACSFSTSVTSIKLDVAGRPWAHGPVHPDVLDDQVVSVQSFALGVLQQVEKDLAGLGRPAALACQYEQVLT